MISVLFVDDELVLLDIGRLFLERMGDFRVTGVESGTLALEHLKKGRYDAIVSDYEMPDMDGITLLRTVREQYGDLPFILFTGRGREDVAGEAVNIGADFYIQKGGDPKGQFHEISHKIEQAVERRRARIAIKESEQRFYDIINFLPDATFAINTEGRIIAWNREVERITGEHAGDMMGRKNYTHAIPFYGERRPMIIDLVLNPDPEREQTYPSLHREGDVITAEGALHFPEGRRYFFARASVLYDRFGDPAGAIESLRDITHIKETEKRLLRIVSGLPIALMVFQIWPDESLVCIDANPASELVTHIPVNEMLSRTAEDIFADIWGGNIIDECRRIALEGGTREFTPAPDSRAPTEKTNIMNLFQSAAGEVAVTFRIE